MTQYLSGAVRADSKYLHGMACHAKILIFTDFVLQFFQGRIGKFYDFSALATDHVIMMSVAELLFVVIMIMAEVAFGD